ncbi:hypothetical protein BH10CYA1_BH10CYA1_03430 [soil metagenome]
MLSWHKPYRSVIVISIAIYVGHTSWHLYQVMSTEPTQFGACDFL